MPARNTRRVRRRSTRRLRTRRPSVVTPRRERGRRSSMQFKNKSRERRPRTPSLTKKKDKIVTKHKLPKIFVINLRGDKDKWNKYKNNDKYVRYSACNGIEMSQANPYYDKLIIMWNAGDRKKKCTAGILNSHMSLIKKIAKAKIDQALVIEDDAIVDFKKLESINLNKLPTDSIIYFGGTLHPPKTFNDKKWNVETVRKDLKKGINVIDTTKYRVLGGHGYYFPKWERAQELLEIMEQKPKMRALDSEMVKLQRKGIIKYMYYPAISYLNLKDAKKGVHAAHFDDVRTMKYYGGS